MQLQELHNTYTHVYQVPLVLHREETIAFPGYRHNLELSSFHMFANGS